jgi:hypothetical protein
MTEAELEAERLAILADEQELAEAHKRLHLTPNDLPAHATHRVRLNDHAERVRAFKDALQQRRAAPLWPRPWRTSHEWRTSARFASRHPLRRCTGTPIDV